jgi:hypothetical protein
LILSQPPALMETSNSLVPPWKERELLECAYMVCGGKCVTDGRTHTLRPLSVRNSATLHLVMHLSKY